MRVWLVDDRQATSPQSLDWLLRHLTAESDDEVRVLGSGPFWTGLVAELRNTLPDVLILHAPAWPEGAGLTDLLEKGLGLVVCVGGEEYLRFLTLAEVYPVWLLPPVPDREVLRLALLGTFAAQRRHNYYLAQIAHLQQRLRDRVVIERAKGVLMHRLGITEEEAYNRLRVLARRQRRQMQDVAQSLLDTECLLLPEVNELAEGNGSEVKQKALGTAY
jgi:hypothetical protein